MGPSEWVRSAKQADDWCRVKDMGTTTKRCPHVCAIASITTRGSSRIVGENPSSVSLRLPASPQGEAFQCQAFPLRGRCPEGADEVSLFPRIT